MRRDSLLSRIALVLAIVAFAGRALASPQTAPSAPVAPPEALSMADLEELVGPIALYPDELLANVLAASVYPDELKEAQAYVKSTGDKAKIDDQTWESPVKAMARIPDLLEFLVENIDWTTAVGQAYIVQSKDLMAAVQSLRAKAKANGALKTNEQMTVVQDASTIIIEPSDPQIIYVPDYDPDIVYVDHYDDDSDVWAAGIIGFGAGLFVGACFDDDFDCFWGGGCVGWGWGHSDIDIDNDFNIETGDINIGSGNEINRGDRTTNRERTRNNNAGREGKQWQPNSSKVNTDAIRQPGGASKLNDFKGTSTGQARGGKVPSQTTARPRNASTGSPARTGSGASAGNTGRPSSANRASSSRAPSSASRAPSSASRAPSSRPPSASSGRVPTPRTQAPRAPSSANRSAPARSKPSGFSPSRGSSSSSARGRSSSGYRGGGSRGGGGRGGGGRR